MLNTKSLCIVDGSATLRVCISFLSVGNNNTLPPLVYLCHNRLDEPIVNYEVAMTAPVNVMIGLLMVSLIHCHYCSLREQGRKAPVASFRVNRSGQDFSQVAMRTVKLH